MSSASPANKHAAVVARCYFGGHYGQARLLENVPNAESASRLGDVCRRRPQP